MNSINFNDAVSYRYCTEVSFSQGLLQCADAYLNLNGRTAVVIPGVIRDGSQETIIVQETPSFIVIALKISSYIITLGIVPIVMLIVKDCLRSSHKFHVTNMTEAESTQVIRNLEVEKGYRDAFAGQCRRLSSWYTNSNEIVQLLTRIPAPDRENFVTLGLRLTSGLGYTKILCLEILADIPNPERSAFVTQGLRITANEYSYSSCLEVLSGISHAERDAFVTQVLRVFALEVGNVFWNHILNVLSRVPHQEREQRVTRAVNQLAIDFPPGVERLGYIVQYRLTELLETAIAEPITHFHDIREAVVGPDGRIDVLAFLGGFAGQPAAAAAAGINVHAAGRDERTSAAMVLLRNATGAMTQQQIDQANREFLAYLRRRPASANRTLAERAFIGPRDRGNPFGPLQPDATFTIHGLAIPGKEVVARLWRFSNTYVDRARGANIEGEKENARRAMVAALTGSYDAHGMVCNPGKVQRLAVSVLQGRLDGVNIDQVAVAAAVPAMTAQVAIRAFWADERHHDIGNRATLRIAADRFIDQNPNMQGFRGDLRIDVDTFAVNQELPEA
ncbi:MAG: hypothetical protein NTX49_07920 [Chlamydiae bacterium]|nr:hypothetical protein [Chlamydiota bacterium]